MFWAWLVERMSLGFGSLKPQIALALDRYYWFHERHWHMFGLTQLAAPFAGTPFKNIFSRLEGVRMGKMVFDDGVRWTEYTLMEIGDYANLNALSIVWPHSLEEGVFKSDRIKIGAGCTLHSGCLVHYGVTMGDHVVLEPNSYLMKGEILDPHTTWRGNPAKEVIGEPSEGTEQETAEASFRPRSRSVIWLSIMRVLLGTRPSRLPRRAWTDPSTFIGGFPATPSRRWSKRRASPKNSASRRFS